MTSVYGGDPSTIAATDSALDDLDLAGGMMLGSDERVPALAVDRAESVRQALQGVVRDALRRPPCLVSFSGGRDSSAVLALAVDLARAEGLPLPVPATLRFPGDRRADESCWQDELLDKLRLRDRWRKELTTELELLGPLAVTAMLRHGLRYPVNAHFHVPLFRAARGGSLLSGVGGDELFEPHTWGRSASILAGRARPRRDDLVELLCRALPRRGRATLLARSSLMLPTWLTSAGRQAVARRCGHWLASDPVRYDEHLRQWWWRSRYFRHGHASLELLAADHGVAYRAPFMHARVLGAVATERAGRGFLDRDAAMRALFGDLLPPAVVRRASKADFTAILVGPETRAFALRADPAGIVEGRFVDVARLRDAWQLPDVDVRSLLALRACWLDRAGIIPRVVRATP
ncbi:MAG TPA: asparagine synthase-related protein [Acidimicrobiales bacterium]|nr:asparagine synthase-related protein [Acidimicrobiales bacterium]